MRMPPSWEWATTGILAQQGNSVNKEPSGQEENLLSAVTNAIINASGADDLPDTINTDYVGENPMQSNVRPEIMERITPPEQANAFIHEQVDDKKMLLTVHEDVVRIRVSASCGSVRVMLQTMQRGMLILLPLIVLLSPLISCLMMSRCIRPIYALISGK